MKEKGACFVNYYSLLACPLAVCLANRESLENELVACGRSLAICLSNSKLKTAAIFMPHDFVGEEFRSGSAA